MSSSLSSLIPSASKEPIEFVEDVRRPLFVAQVVYNKGLKKYAYGQQLLVISGTEVAVMDTSDEEKAGKKDKSSVYIEIIPLAAILEVRQKNLDLYIRYTSPGTTRTSPAVFGFGEGNSSVPISLSLTGPVITTCPDPSSSKGPVITTCPDPSSSKVITTCSDPSTFGSAAGSMSTRGISSGNLLTHKQSTQCLGDRDLGTYSHKVDDYSSSHLLMKDAAAMAAAVATIGMAKNQLDAVNTLVRRAFLLQRKLEISQVLEVCESDGAITQKYMAWGRQKESVVFDVPPSWSKLALKEGMLGNGGHAFCIHAWTPLGMAVATMSVDLFLEAAGRPAGTNTVLLAVPAEKHAQIMSKLSPKTAVKVASCGDAVGADLSSDADLSLLSPELLEEYQRVSDECAFISNVQTKQLVGMYPQQVRELGTYAVMHVSVSSQANSTTQSVVMSNVSMLQRLGSNANPICLVKATAGGSKQEEEAEQKVLWSSAAGLAVAPPSISSAVVPPSFMSALLMYTIAAWNLVSGNVMLLARQFGAPRHAAVVDGDPILSPVKPFLLTTPAELPPSKTHRVHITGMQFFKELPLSLERQLAHIKTGALSHDASSSTLDRTGSWAAAAVASIPKLPTLLSDPEPSWLTYDVKDRFLALSKGKLPDAKHMASNTNKWRQDNEIDKLITERTKHADNFKFFQEHLDHSLLWASEDGFVVQVVKAADFGRLASAMKARGMTSDDLALHFALYFEFCWSKLATQPLESGAGRIVQMVDLKGVSMSMALGDGLYCLQAITSITKHYPMRMHRTMMLNPPSYLNMAWSVIQKALDPVVAAKVKVASKKDALAELQNYMPLDMIPAEYGGGNSTPLQDYPPQQQLEALIDSLCMQDW